MCTNISITAKNGDVIVARTMDFASATGQNYGEFTEFAIPFKAKFSKTAGIKMISDGQNKAGLSIGTLWLPATKFNNNLGKLKDDEISALSLPQQILGTCKDISAVIKLLTGKKLTLPIAAIDQFATVHLAVVDASGKSIVVEWGTNGQAPGMPNFYDNATGILTNAPEFPWHLTNLNTVAHYQKFNVSSKQDMNGVEVATTGFGNNLFGLPGDPTPVSRFIRANVLLNLATNYEQPKDAQAAMLLLDKLMGYVNVIKGTSANHGTVSPDYDYTQWTVLKDLKNYKMYQKSDTDLGYSELVCPVVKLESDND